jgi:hypothetical protein
MTKLTSELMPSAPGRAERTKFAPSQERAGIPPDKTSSLI